MRENYDHKIKHYTYVFPKVFSGSFSQLREPILYQNLPVEFLVDIRVEDNYPEVLLNQETIEASLQESLLSVFR